MLLINQDVLTLDGPVSKVKLMKKWTKKIQQTITFFMISFSLASCQKHSDNHNQTLRINLQDGDPASLHPHHVAGGMQSRILGKAIYEGLTRLNPEGKIEVSGAKSVEISPSGTQYLFTLRDHKWSDGSSVTAYQYEKAWKKALAPTTDCPKADLFYVIKGAKKAKKGEISIEEVGVKALDHETLLVELTHPAPYFLELISLPIFAPLDRETLLYNGPFSIETWLPNNLLRLKKNTYFWDAKNVLLQSIEFSFISQPMTTFSMYEKGDLDWMGSPFDHFPLELVSDLQEKGNIQQQYVTRPFWIYLNTQHPPLSSTSIRQALSLALNRSAINEHMLFGSLPLYTPLPHSLSLCEKSLSDNDLAQAKQLFEKGLKELGFTQATFPPLYLNYFNTTGFSALAEYLQEAWEKTFGIKVVLEKSEWRVFLSKLETSDFQIAGCTESSLYQDPIELLERFGESNRDNPSNWISIPYQKKIELAQKEPNFGRREQYLKEAEEMLLSEMPFIPISNFIHFYDHHPKLTAYVLDHTGCVDFRWAYFKK